MNSKYKVVFGHTTMPKSSKRFIFCKCVRKTCPYKYHVITDPELRSIIRDEYTKGVIIHVRNNKDVVFIENT